MELSAKPCDNLKKRDVAQLGSAPLWGSGGRGFKSRRSDRLKKCITNHCLLLKIGLISLY